MDSMNVELSAGAERFVGSAVDAVLHEFFSQKPEFATAMLKPDEQDELRTALWAVDLPKKPFVAMVKEIQKGAQVSVLVSDVPADSPMLEGYFAASNRMSFTVQATAGSMDPVMVYVRRTN